MFMEAPGNIIKTSGASLPKCQWEARSLLRIDRDLFEALSWEARSLLQERSKEEDLLVGSTIRETHRSGWEVRPGLDVDQHPLPNPVYVQLNPMWTHYLLY